ncbi:hypothetical protein HOL63_02065 [Candidatus Peregrinibacteria bacterium]|nr:hypothetical protein [Candidatus Peregrinibacteria bacterium]MBT5468515.1 hypothetical protein [Candidatus Peregrinibacteria bacterium]
MNIPAFVQSEGNTFTITVPIGMQLRETVALLVPHGASVVITSEEDSQAMVSLTLEGAASVDVTVQANATLSVVSLQTDPGVVRHKNTVSDGGTVHVQNISLAAEVDHELRSFLQGEHAVSNVDWIFYAKHAEKHRISARNIFDAKYGGGEIIMKGVAEHTAHVFCDGMIEIGLQGGGTDTYLTENVLMLDGTAKVDAIPGLEIKTNDVKASHSATVSKVTPEDLFYFATRGIDETEARQMYIQGFLGDLTAKITDTAVQDILLEQIEQKLIA